MPGSPSKITPKQSVLSVKEADPKSTPAPQIEVQLLAGVTITRLHEHAASTMSSQPRRLLSIPDGLQEREDELAYIDLSLTI